MNVKELTIKSRSYRCFDNDVKIPREKLLDFIDTTRFTPSSVNYQPLKYYISCDDETNAVIRPTTFWARLLKDYDGPEGKENPSAYIVILHDKTIAPNCERFDRDVGIAAQTILLAATEAGFGGCMIGNFDGKKLSGLLSLPEQYEPRLVVALGKPAEKIILEPIGSDGKAAYYRDAAGLHHVPKRSLDEIIIK